MTDPTPKCILKDGEPFPVALDSSNILIKISNHVFQEFRGNLGAVV